MDPLIDPLINPLLDPLIDPLIDWPTRDHRQPLIDPSVHLVSTSFDEAQEATESGEGSCSGA